MCDPGALDVEPTAYESMPVVIQSDDPLLNVGKKELLIALRMPHQLPWVADWLFRHHTDPFHKQSMLAPEAFDNSLALHMHQDICTPGTQCRQTPAPPNPPKAERISDTGFVVTKDIDLLIVPVAALDGITVGYTFLNGVQEATVGKYSAWHAGPQQKHNFISGRFAFDEKRKDYIMVVNGMSPHMTGIVSLRWRDNNARDNAFFAIPKADYGPNNLPSRVLSVQCNVDYVVPRSFDNPARPESSTNAPEQQPPQQPSANTSMDDILNLKRDPFVLDAVFENPWSEEMSSLETIGTVLPPDDSGLLPELIPDFNAHVMHDIDQILGDALQNAFSPPTDTMSSSTNPSLSTEYPATSPQSPLSANSCSYSPSNVVIDAPPLVNQPESWLISSSSPPDGVGVPRLPGHSETSSGAFNMSALSESLLNIESSMMGQFFSHKLRKDILHPQTGELMSRCTGQSTTKLDSVDRSALLAFRHVAAQRYYATHLSIGTDTRLITAPVPIRSAPVKKRARERAATMLAPRPVPVENDAGKDEESIRQGKLQAKRIKNRMSAAKSNQKRRQHLESQRKELSTLKRRVEELTSRKDTMAEANDSLRKRIKNES